jgi:hypothetical protein
MVITTTIVCSCSIHILTAAGTQDIFQALQPIITITINSTVPFATLQLHNIETLQQLQQHKSYGAVSAFAHYTLYMITAVAQRTNISNTAAAQFTLQPTQLRNPYCIQCSCTKHIPAVALYADVGYAGTHNAIALWHRKMPHRQQCTCIAASCIIKL